MQDQASKTLQKIQVEQTPLKLAFIGGGVNSAVGGVHFCASQMDNKFNVVAGAFSRNPDFNRDTAKVWNVAFERTYHDWRELVAAEQDQVDAFVVLTPTPHHGEVLQQLFELQLPVICEKALVTGPTEITQLKAQIKPNQFLAVTLNYSGYAMVRELRHLVAEGRLGRIQKIHLEMPQEGFRRPPDIAGKAAAPQNWRLQDGEVPTICLDLGVHLHHLSSFILGVEPEQVVAEFNNHSHYPGLIDDVQLLLKYPDNIAGSMWMSKTAIGHRNGLKIRLYGEQGSACWYQLNPDELNLSFYDGRREILDRAGVSEYAGQLRYNRMKPGHPSGFVEAFANLYADIADALHQYQRASGSDVADINLTHPFVYGLDHAADGLKLFAAAYESIEKQGWTKIKEPNNAT